MRFLLLSLLISLSTSAQVTNVKIGQIKRSVEPSICIDPKNPNVLVAGAVLDELYVSTDQGKSWSSEHLKSSYGVWGDPAIIVDTAGSFYYFHLSNPINGHWIDRIVCQRSDDQGKTWNNGSYVGLNGACAQDKHWAVVDRKTNTIYLTWTQFDKYASKASKDSSIILFSRSTDRGESWTTPKRINRVAGNCLDSSETTEGAVPCVGPKGEVYVSWAGPDGLRFDRSNDAGDTWLNEDILIDEMATGWDFEVPGLSRCNGLPITACDISGSPFHGRIYVNWSDQRNGLDNTDIWLRYSDDGGNTWSSLKRVNGDSGAHHQFLTWMSLDPTNGNLYFVYYDRRAYSDEQTDVYLATSYDGGETFVERKISEKPFIPRTDIFFGDYNNISVYDGVVRPIWARADGKTTSVWTALYQEQDQTGVSSEPTYSKQSIKVKLKKEGPVSIYIADQSGNQVSVVKKDLVLPKGKNTVVFYPTREIEPGTYILEVVTPRKTKRSEVVLTP